MVGAPRAQSFFDRQREIDEPGMVYKCSIKSSNCEPFTIDTLGNINRDYDTEYDGNCLSEFKAYQWLGASLDGSSKDDGRFVVRIFFLSFNEM